MEDFTDSEIRESSRTTIEINGDQSRWTTIRVECGICLVLVIAIALTVSKLFKCYSKHVDVIETWLVVALAVWLRRRLQELMHRQQPRSGSGFQAAVGTDRLMGSVV